MNKGYTAADIVEQCRRLDRAGIRCCFFYLVGISGTGQGKISAKTYPICSSERFKCLPVSWQSYLNKYKIRRIIISFFFRITDDVIKFADRAKTAIGGF